jgi:hypothetical protein
MGTGMLAATCLCMVLSQSSGDVFYTNQRNHGIPVNVPDAVRGDFREFLLYASSDQGRNWQQVGAIPASKNNFAFYAQADGTYWFQVATVSKQGVQDPDDRALMKGAPHLKMVIDTLKPIMKSFQAQRVGDEVAVTWDVQEEYPDLSREGFRLEYQNKDALVETWIPIPAQAALKGRITFRPTTNQTLIVRLTVRDLAANQSYSQAEVAGTVATVGFNGQPAVTPEPLTATLPGGITIPRQPSENGNKAILPPPPPPGNLIMPPPKEIVADNVVADSRIPPKIDPPKAVAPSPQFPPPAGGIQPQVGDGFGDVKTLAHATPARKPLPMLQHVNHHLVKLQYEIKRQGPSGIGGIQIWLTKDDGETWNPYAEVKDLNNEAVHGRQEREFEFRDKFDAPFPDGVYGLIMVVKNRAGLGREPRPGDAPEIRIEIDTKPPVAQLFKPLADPANPNQLLLKWSAQDKNLDDTPINLEYSEKREGPWQPIEVNLKNTGRYTNQLVTGDYSWKVPANAPVQVYLRLRVRDKAGNESVAVTAEPQFVDLIEPEGALIGVLPQPKR